MKTLLINQIEIGKGKPKIIVPAVGQTLAELTSEAFFFQKKLDLFDVLEWRVDHFAEINSIDAIKNVLQTFHSILPNKPILFTCRTANEGGAITITPSDYVKLNHAIICSGLIHLVDVEIFIGDKEAQAIIQYAHQHHVYVIASNHDFTKTPSQQSIIQRLNKMQAFDADILKIAVMPNSPQDVLTLLSATNEMKQNHTNKPLITMSMGKLGAISRISGEIFGSDMTFASGAQASAPGQIDMQTLNTMLNALN